MEQNGYCIEGVYYESFHFVKFRKMSTFLISPLICASSYRRLLQLMYSSHSLSSRIDVLMLLSVNTPVVTS